MRAFYLTCRILFFTGIRDNKGLKSIDFEGNKIGDAGGRRILAAVKNNSSIMDVTIMPLNNISLELQDKIREALKERQA